MPVFLIGILVYFAASDKRRHLPIFWANLGVYASVLILVILPFVEGRSLLLDHIKSAFCFGLLAFCLACGAKTFVVNKLSCFIGKVSFSCYLWHFAVLFALFDRLLAAGGSIRSDLMMLHMGGRIFCNSLRLSLLPRLLYPL